MIQKCSNIHYQYIMKNHIAVIIIIVIPTEMEKELILLILRILLKKKKKLNRNELFTLSKDLTLEYENHNYVINENTITNYNPIELKIIN